MNEKIKVLVITLKGNIKYQIGNVDKKVSDVIKEIKESESDFYQIIDACAVKISEIISVEIVECDPEEGEKNDKTKSNNA